MDGVSMMRVCEDGTILWNGVRYAPERTCRVTESSYDELLDEVYTDLSCGHWTRLSEREVSYCPKCGAKIERTNDAD